MFTIFVSLLCFALPKFVGEVAHSWTKRWGQVYMKPNILQQLNFYVVLPFTYILIFF